MANSKAHGGSASPLQQLARQRNWGKRILMGNAGSIYSAYRTSATSKEATFLYDAYTRCQEVIKYWDMNTKILLDSLRERIKKQEQLPWNEGRGND